MDRLTLQDWGIDPATFNADDAWDLSDVARSGLIPGREAGKRICLQTVQRYANRKKGCRPLGPAGPRLVLPAILQGHKHKTMKAWVELFRKKALEVEAAGSDASPRPRTEQQAKAGHKRAMANLAKEGFAAATKG